MSDMKLIMESWRQFQLTEELELNTVGDLKKAIKAMRQAQASGDAGKKALEFIADQIPILNNIKSIWDKAKDAKNIVKNLYGMDDGSKTNTNLDKLNVDDNISKIVDDPIEVDFLNYLADERFADDSESLDNFDVNAELEKFIADKFQGHTVKK